jgi:hypothetical protein
MGWRLLFAIVATVIAVMITKPVASFKSMAGLDPSRHYLGELLRRAGGTALGVVAGHRLVDRSVDAARDVPLDSTGVSGAEGTTYRVQPVEPSMPPLPPPRTVHVLAGGYSSAPRQGWSVAEEPAALESRPVRGPERRALPAPILRQGGEPLEPSRGYRVSPDAVPPAEVAEPLRYDQPRPVQPVGAVPVVTGAVVRRPLPAQHAEYPAEDLRARPNPADREATTQRSTAPAGEVVAATHPRINPVEHEPAARAAGTTVAYPTGIVVQQEQGIYRPDRPLRVEEYLRFPEPQLDANGDESWTPLYHAKAAR